MIDTTKLNARDRARIEHRKALKHQYVYAHDASSPGQEHFDLTTGIGQRPSREWHDFIQSEYFPVGKSVRIDGVSIAGARSRARQIEAQSTRLFRVERLSDSSIRITRVW